MGIHLQRGTFSASRQSLFTSFDWRKRVDHAQSAWSIGCNVIGCFARCVLTCATRERSSRVFCFVSPLSTKGCRRSVHRIDRLEASKSTKPRPLGRSQTNFRFQVCPPKVLAGFAWYATATCFVCSIRQWASWMGETHEHPHPPAPRHARAYSYYIKGIADIVCNMYAHV